MSELKINKKLFQDRKRTNILSEPEQKLISYLVPRIPNWITSDGLTAIGFLGSLMILGSFILALDIVMDWISTVFIGLGYVLYTVGDFKYLGFTLVALYGWAMIISQLRYRITDKYTIDAGILGPTEIRVIISLVMLFEVLMPGSINWCVLVICIALFIINTNDTRLLLKLGDEKDKEDKLKKQQEEAI